MRRDVMGKVIKCTEAEIPLDRSQTPGSTEEEEEKDDGIDLNLSEFYGAKSSDKLDSLNAVQ